MSSNTEVHMPLVSVVTVVKNGASSISKAIQSLDDQTYQNWEHLIVDGKSNDGTIEVISTFKSPKRTIVSEFDSGIYEAFNKGVLRAKGKYISFLNCDDWYEEDFLSLAVGSLENTDADWVFGDNTFHFANGQTRFLPGDPFYMNDPWKDFSRFHHTTVLAKRSLFEEVGLFPYVLKGKLFKGRKIRIANDYLWFLKCQKSGAVGVHNSKIQGHMTWGGLSTSKHVEANLEAFLIAVQEFGPRPKLILIWLRRIFHAYLLERSIRIPKKKLSKITLKFLKRIWFSNVFYRFTPLIRRILGARNSDAIYNILKLLES